MSAKACGNCGQWLEAGPAARRPAPAPSRRRLPVWVIVLFGGLAAIVAVSAVVLTLNRGPGRGASIPPPTLVSLVPATTATEPIHIPAPAETLVAPTEAKLVPTNTPAPPTDTPAPSSTEAPAPQLTSTVALSPEPTSTQLPAPTSTPVPTETPLPSPTPTAVAGVPAVLPGRIAFPVFDPERGTYDVYVANPDGSGMQRVIEEASQPALSPDGQRIAFRRWRSDDRGIEVMNTYGGDQNRLTNFLEDALPSWSPNGQILVFFSRRESDRKIRIYQVNAAGGSDWELKRGIGPVHGEYPTWMPDGSIAYRVTWPDQGLAVMNADGSDDRMIFLDGSATAPAASPDGKYIALMSQRDGNWEVYRINVDGSGLLRLTDHGANDGLPTWSPDGNTIAFVSDRDGTWAIWAMTSTGQRHRQLFALPGSPDGLVRNEPDYSSRGWVEERISWGP